MHKINLSYLIKKNKVDIFGFSIFYLVKLYILHRSLILYKIKSEDSFTQKLTVLWIGVERFIFSVRHEIHFRIHFYSTSCENSEVKPEIQWHNSLPWNVGALGRLNNFS